MQATPAAKALPGLAMPSRRWWILMLWLVVLGLMSTRLFTFERTWVFVGNLIHLVHPGPISGSTHALIHLIIRKAAHFGAYTVFFLILVSGPLRGRPYWALLICLAASSADEIHQLYVPGRTGSAYDVAVDFTGAVFGRFLHMAISARQPSRD